MNEDPVPFLRPSVPDPEALVEDLRVILSSGILTNGPYVEDLERRLSEYLGVRHCVAVASCTTGLMLLLKAAGLSGEVVVPSFTFSATVHAVAWNGLRPVFADIDPATLTLSAGRVGKAVTEQTSAILATHTSGTPCDVEGLAEVADRSGARLFFDAAHALGSRHDGVPVGGFGDAEVFSLSPTKVLVAGEGGVIATNDDALAQRCRIGRNYGDPGGYDPIFAGLNGRMSEIHAAIALHSLEGLEERVSRRNTLAELYWDLLDEVSGLSFPEVRQGDRSTYKDFTVLIDRERFGLGPHQLAEVLLAEGIATRRYYAPPVHTTRAYRGSSVTEGELPVTRDVASRVLTLPLWTEMTEGHVTRVAEAIGRAGSGPRGAPATS